MGNSVFVHRPFKEPGEWLRFVHPKPIRLSNWQDGCGFYRIDIGMSIDLGR